MNINYLAVTAIFILNTQFMSFKINWKKRFLSQGLFLKKLDKQLSA